MFFSIYKHHSEGYTIHQHWHDQWCPWIYEIILTPLFQSEQTLLDALYHILEENRLIFLSSLENQRIEWKLGQVWDFLFINFFTQYINNILIFSSLNSSQILPISLSLTFLLSPPSKKKKPKSQSKQKYAKIHGISWALILPWNVVDTHSDTLLEKIDFSLFQHISIASSILVNSGKPYHYPAKGKYQ